MNVLAFSLLAAAVAFVGAWGRRAAPTLVGVHFDSRARAKKQRVIRRGGLACYAVAMAFTAFAVADLLVS